MAENHVEADVVVVGAGIAGLMAGLKLQEQGQRVILLDKAHSVGGRMATRRIGPGVADHGAQFFTVRDPEFQEWVDRWLEEDLIFVWSNGFSDDSLNEDPNSGHPRYAVHGGMNALPKYLAQSLRDVRVNTRVVTVTCEDDGWIIQDENATFYTAQALVMAAPVPQALTLLEEGATALKPEDRERLEAVEYAPCLTGLFWVEGRVTLPQPGAVQRRNANVTWIGDNQQKGISPGARLITVQADDRYSAQMWSAPDERILNALRTNLQIFMSDSATIREAQLKRWRYSRPLTVFTERYFFPEHKPLLIFAGDAFNGPRIEGAALSGLAAASALLKAL